MKYNKPRKIKIDDNELYVRVAASDMMHKLIHDALNEKDNRKKLKILKHAKYILNNYYKKNDKEQLMQYNAKCIKDSINLDEKANELKDSSSTISSHQIDFNNSITEIINDRFAKIIRDDLEIMFERKTSYIHLRTTLIKIDEMKFTNVVRFMKSKEMIDFVNQCNDLYYPEENNQIYELNKECKHPAWFKLNNIESRFKGYYVHVDIFMFILMWFNKLYAAKYIKVLNTLLHLSSIKNQTLNQMYKDLINQLTKEIEVKNNQIKELQNIIYSDE